MESSDGFAIASVVFEVQKILSRDSFGVNEDRVEEYVSTRI